MIKGFSNKVTFFLLLFLLSGTGVYALSADSVMQQVKTLADSTVINRTTDEAYALINTDREKTRVIAALCIALSKEIGYRKGEAISHALLGRYYRRTATYDKALANFIAALKIYEELGLHRSISSVCNDMSIIYMNIGAYKRVIRYAMRAKSELQISGNVPFYAITDVNNILGAAHFELKNYDSAFYYFNEARISGIRGNDKTGVAIALDNMSKVYRQKKDLKKALQYLQEAIRLRTDVKEARSLAHSYSTAALLYMDMNDYPRAYKYITQARAIADSAGDVELSIGVQKVLLGYYQATGQYKEAFGVLQKIMVHQDTTSNVQEKNKIAELEALYQTEKKDKENVKLRRENTLKEIDLLNVKLQQRTMIVVMFFLLLMAGTIVYSLYRQGQINRRLSELNVEKNNIMAVLSHDLKAPFTKLHTYIQMLQKSGLSPEEESYTRRMNEVIHEGGEMIQNLLDVTYIEERKPNLNLGEIDLYDALLLIINEHKPSAQRKHISIELHVDVRELVFNTDYQKFKRIIDNLVSNAVKYTNLGSRVTVRAADHEKGILVSIKDEGQGMDREDVELLFTKFSRLKSNPTGGESSTGMGLYIVKNLCALLGGRVWCESSPGAGATFFVYLPFYVEDFV